MKTMGKWQDPNKKNDIEKLPSWRGSSAESKTNQISNEKPVSRFSQRLEFTIFSHQKYQENELIPREIESLKDEIRAEIKALKLSQKQLVTQAEEIENSAFQTISEKGGIYHIHFLEILLSLIRDLRAKATEAKTWLSAMQTKKKKRGSLFAVLSKKKGTQYSLSQELQNTRSVM